jgi:NAD(P)-dependent dehydrogenase (short-subunit alcohol dehydrogenase family)
MVSKGKCLKSAMSLKINGISPIMQVPSSTSSTAAPSDCTKTRGGTVTALGGLDILVNNAGGSRAFLGGSETIPDEEWQRDLALNLLAAVRLTNAVLPALRVSKAAAIVNTSSTAATMPVPFDVHYGAAKAALDYYSRTLAVELGASGIRVNVVSPGPISTPNSDQLRKQWPISGDEWLQYAVASVLPKTSRKSLLASDRGKFLTGVNYRVDGGTTAR